jgi:AcrR family transcriptional regulator
MGIEPATDSLLPLTPARRRQLTRQSLLKAAARVFAEQGFHGASLDDVARAAGFTKGAVYSNFESKEDLFLALLEEKAREEAAALRATLERSTVPPEHRLSDFLSFFEDERPEEAAVWRALYLEFCLYALRHRSAAAKLVAIDRTMAASIAEMIADRRRVQGITGDEPAERMARVVLAMFHGVELARALDPQASDRQFLRASVAFAVRGIGASLD